METLYSRIHSYYDNSFRPQEPYVSLWTSKIKLKTSQMTLYISEFDIKLVHTPGAKMVQSNALSRQTDYIPEVDTYNEDITLLLDNLFMVDLPINLLNPDLQRWIAEDKRHNRSTEILLNRGPNNLQNDLEDWITEGFEGNKVLFYKGKNYVPENLDLWQDILRMFHDHETARHPGELETFNAVREHYRWPGLRSFVRNYVQGCVTCQQFKIDRHPSKLLFIPTEGSHSTRPFSYCSMDLITDLPLADGFDSLLVVVDQGLSKGVILAP
jgi:hypothetical protein